MLDLMRAGREVRLLRQTTRLVAVLTAALCVGGTAFGQASPEPAVQFSGFNAYGTGNYTVGWSFTVYQPIAVSSLGYFDVDSNGLTGPHDVGIWNAAGTLLTSATVPGGTAATLSNGFRYVAIPVVVLPAGTYMIGGLSNNSDIFWADVRNFSTSSLITYGTAYYTEGTTLLRPTIARSDTHASYFGPSMLIAAANIDTPPTADAGVDFSVNEGQTGITLDGTHSNDPDGDALAYSWIQLSGGTAVALTGSNSAHPTFTAPYVSVGGETLTFQLTVTANGQSATDTVSVTVVNVNHPAVADAGDDQTVAEGSVVTLHGDLSFDADADPFTYTWTQVDGPSVTLNGPTSKDPSFSAPFGGAGGAPGVIATLTFALRVNDGLPADVPASGYTFANSTDSVTVQITNTDNPPVADAGVGQTVDEHSIVTLNAGGSTDPDNDPLSYSWQQTGGPGVALSNATSADPTLTAPWVSSGGSDLIFRVTVGDGYGGVSSDTTVVHVQNINDPPLASAAYATVPVLWAPDHRLVSVGIAGVSDPNSNTIITITGVTQDEPTNGLGDGDTPVDAIINPDGTVLLRAERAGTGNGRVYRIAFTASDPEGSASGVVQVTVPLNPKKPAIDSGQTFDSTR